MTYKCIYKTPDNFSNLIMNSDGENLTGLWFEDSKDSSKHIYAKNLINNRIRIYETNH